MCGVFGIYVFLDLCVQLLVVRWHASKNCIDLLDTGSPPPLFMVYIAHDIFKHILAFKDPRYEGVRNGDPYMATPTRGWQIVSERHEHCDCRQERICDEECVLD